jgi:hypothetical protein
MEQIINKRKPNRVLRHGSQGYGYYEWVLVKIVSLEKEIEFTTQWKYRIGVAISENSYYFGKLSKNWIFGTNDELKIGEELKYNIRMA